MIKKTQLEVLSQYQIDQMSVNANDIIDTTIHNCFYPEGSRMRSEDKETRLQHVASTLTVLF